MRLNKEFYNMYKNIISPNVLERMINQIPAYNDEDEITQAIQRFEQSKRQVGVFAYSQDSTMLTYRIPYFRLLYVLNGRIYLNIEGKSVECTRGCFIIANEHTHIEYKNFSKDSVVITLFFKRNFFTDFNQIYLRELSLFEDLFFQSSQKLTQPIVCSLPPNYYTLNYLSLMVEVVRMSTQTNREITSLLYLLLSYLETKRNRPFEHSELTIPAHLMIEEMLVYIKENYQTVHLQQMADHFGVTSNYLSLLIKKETGESFLYHVQEARLAVAKELIVTTDYTNETICHLIGYKDCSYFYRLFKEKFGCTPREYRKQKEEEDNYGRI